MVLRQCFPFLGGKRRVKKVPKTSVESQADNCTENVAKPLSQPLKPGPENISQFSSLPSTLWVQIIKKLDSQSYFCIQQTCKRMSELVQNSREIKTTINGDLSWKRDDNGSIYFDCKFMPNWKIPRGIRCSGITLPKDAQLREFFEETCRALKSQRITCTRFFLDSNILNNDQWAILFNQLKPVHICVYSDLSNRYEVLLKAEQRRGNHLSLSLQFEDAIPALFNVLPRFQDVRFNVLAMKIEATSSSSLIEWILEFLSSQTLPDLRKFDVLLFSSEEGNIAPSNELRQQYARFNPVVLKQREMVDHTMKCVFLQNESFCIASLNFFCSKIEYRKGIEE